MKLRNEKKFKENERGKEKMGKKNKKKLLMVLGISILTVLGGTIAYFTTSTDLTSLFKVGLYQHEIIEEFVSPEDWTPGTTTPKTIEITNNGSISMAVRASYTESWASANNTPIPLKDAEDNIASIINFNTGWTKDVDGYYYYGTKENKTKLEPNQTTSSFISGVTFNENIKLTLTQTTSQDGHEITYTSSGTGYDNATYKLTIKIDTIQYDQANNVW
ncbi:MAG: BsaA family SipW-dependent biofilm matrix protein [bacterium]|nr:BsaA family SipW-dependent biofilm matrix protein [bacterium]